MSDIKTFGGIKKSDLFSAWIRTNKMYGRYQLNRDYFPCDVGKLVFCRSKADGIFFAGIVVRGSERQSDLVLLETMRNEPFNDKRAGELCSLMVEDHAFLNAEHLSNTKKQEFQQWLDEKRNFFALEIAFEVANSDQLAEQEKEATRHQAEKIAVEKLEKKRLKAMEQAEKKRLKAMELVEKKQFTKQNNLLEKRKRDAKDNVEKEQAILDLEEKKDKYALESTVSRQE